jgi:hypothetical protein
MVNIKVLELRMRWVEHRGCERIGRHTKYFYENLRGKILWTAYAN